MIGVDGALVFGGPDVLAAPTASAVNAPTVLRAWASPARGQVTAAFALSRAVDATLSVYDVSGRRVATLREGGTVLRRTTLLVVR